jgi:hypothetical protein
VNWEGLWGSFYVLSLFRIGTHLKQQWENYSSGGRNWPARYPVQPAIIFGNYERLTTLIGTYVNVRCRCYATITRGNKRCLVAAGKHVNNIRASARQLHGNEFQRQWMRMQRSRYYWTITMETVFSMWFVLRCYKQDSLKQRVSCQNLSAVS